jgi:hypothetical protein
MKEEKTERERIKMKEEITKQEE